MKHLHFDNESFCERIRKNIKRCRTEQGLTADQLAEKAGISLGFLSQSEAPNLSVGISLATLFSIAEVLQVPPSKLLEFD